MRPRVTSDQRRNVMASRKLAQQRVLRIMQEQSSGPIDRTPIEAAAERQAPSAPAARTEWRESEKPTQNNKLGA